MLPETNGVLLNTSVTIPGEAILCDVIAALSGNLGEYESLAIADQKEGTDRAFEYAVRLLHPFFTDTPGPLQAAVDCAVRLRGASRERLLGEVHMSDFPRALKNLDRIAHLSDDALRWTAINAAFAVALDQQEGTPAEVFVIRRYPDGRQVARRLGIREISPAAPTPSA